MKIKNLLIGLAGAALFVVSAVPALAQTHVGPTTIAPYYPTTPMYSQPVATSCPTLTYNLVRGSNDYFTRGQVSQLQQFLRSRYGDARISGGYYGSITTWYVAKFQQEQGLYPVTGGVGPLTRAAIARVCSDYPTPSPQPTLSFVSISPSQGTVGTRVVLQGSGFTQDNRVHFGSGGAVHVPSYNNGTLIYFTVPSIVGPCDWVGDTSPIRCFAAGAQVVPGVYQISVENSNGQSAALNFTVTGNTGCTYPNQCVGGMTVSSPTQGQQVQNGTVLPITWSAPVTPGSASTVLDLYTAQGTKVGTVAISSASSGTYNWTVPRVPNIYMCTMQYPNGLCGQNLSGRYYIKATLVTGNGLDGGTTLGSDVSGTFTINSTQDYPYVIIDCIAGYHPQNGQCVSY